MRTLAEARGFIRELPISEQARVEWLSAATLLSEAAEKGGSHILMARKAVERALRRTEPLSGDR